MGLGRRKKTVLERKLDQVEKEAEGVRGNIKVVSRALKKAADGTPIRVPQLREESAGEQDVPINDADAPGKDTREVATSPVEGDLFKWQQKSGAPIEQETIDQASDQASSATGKAVRPERKQTVKMDQKLANYLTSGSFFPATSVRRDRSVQRNKAVFMVVIVAVVAFVIYKIARHF